MKRIAYTIMPYTTVIRLHSVIRNPGNGFPARLLGLDAQARFSGARLDVIEQMARLATNEQCEFVVVCGDVFESNQVQRQVLVRSFEKMAAFPQLTFFLLPGNHDPLDASSIYSSPTFIERRPENVKVLKGFEPVQAAPGVELIPAPWPNKHPTTDLVEAACGRLEQSSSLRIIVGHGAIDFMSPDPNDPKVIALERLEERISVGLIHYVALGDRHSTTNVGTTGRVYYSGAPEPTDYDETNPGNVLIVDLGADHVDVVVKHLVLQRRFMEGGRRCYGRGQRGVSCESIWPVRCAPGHLSAIAAVLPGRTALWAGAHAPLGTPGAW